MSPSGEGSSLAIAKIVAERAHADAKATRVDVAEARNAELTTRVSVLEDSWDRLNHLTLGMPSRGFLDDL